MIIIIFVLSFCSILYELVLAQSLSAFLENTILRYSVTIGLYMFSLGIGSLLAEGKMVQNARRSLINTEILLTVLGGFSVCLLFVLENSDGGRLAVSLGGHGLIIAIGILSGMELPLLMELTEHREGLNENTVLALSYLGAFAGTLAFVFLFYSKLGILVTSFVVGSLNGLCAWMLYAKAPGQEKKEMMPSAYGVILYCLLIALLVCLANSKNIIKFFLQQYLS